MTPARQEWAAAALAATDAVVAVYPSHAALDEAITALQRSRFDMKKLSIVGKDYYTDQQVVGYYNAGDRMKYWGKLGAFWGYTMWIRVGLPGTTSAMAIPINYYGRQVGLPEPLTRAMITPASADGSRADRAAEAIGLTDAVMKHLAGAP